MDPTNDIASLRLSNQRVIGAAKLTPDAVVAWMGAMQAQDYDAATWAIGLRSDADAGVVEATIAQGSIVRTWLLRGTLHFVAAADARWMLVLLGPRLIANSARRYRQLGLDDESLAHCCDVFAEALRGGGQLTRAEMLQVVEVAGISTEGQRGYHILRHAGLRAVICFGPMRTKQETFVLLEEWAYSTEDVSSIKDIDGDAALTELAWRYFRSHGPATLQDFVWWSSLRVADARAGVELAGDRLEQIIHSDQYNWAPRTSVSHELASSPSAHLLPAYDEYYIGYQDRTAILDPAYENQRVSSSGVFRPMVVIDGQIVGIWKQERKKNSVEIKLELFRVFTDVEVDALAETAGRYSVFLGKPVRLA